MDLSGADEPPEALTDGDPWQRAFHSLVREYVVTFLLFLLLLVIAHAAVQRYARREQVEFSPRDDEEATVNRTALLLCTFSLALAAGAALLLPISIAANEVLLHYPDSYYVRWLNSSLIQGIWKYIFLLSNLSLFVLLPFAYLFTESEGFAGARKGLASRVYETFVVLCLLAVLVVGIAYVLSAFLDGESGRKSLQNVWTNHLPLLYSWISCFGVLCLLLCTPLGFARLFDLVGRLIVRPHLMDDIEERCAAARLEADALTRRVAARTGGGPERLARAPYEESAEAVATRLEEVRGELERLERRRKASPLQRNLGYPLVMLMLLTLTAAAEFMVLRNALELLIGVKALPLSTQQVTLGITSLSALGPIGAALEIVLIFYFLLTSLVGFYSLPALYRLRPSPGDTSIPSLIANCAVVLVISSALPLLMRTLGITNFDLLGHYGKVRWLGDFNVVLFYNVVFAVGSALGLVTKFTAAMRQALLGRLRAVRRSLQARGGAVQALLLGGDVGNGVGSGMGSPVVGSPVGSTVGSPVGSTVGSPVGSTVGSPVGSTVGSPQKGNKQE
ncbi:protein LMBR1L-like [Amphibalanus amphitrite]|uniref:protein LMBR1L-like n=1 Tax=Amphibalanus amphitrite TaxID=1232801 RepID=UPI001C9181D6|nr:protein LMBR1L-like [Amphibalanus amphitrite]